jgi:hypothetical protein
VSWLRGPPPRADLGHRISTATSAVGSASAGSCSA